MRILLGVVLAAFATIAFAQTETWEGEFQTPLRPTFVLIELYGTTGALKVLGRTIPITSVTRTDARLRVASDNTSIDGAVSGEQWTGTLTSGKETFPIALTRVPVLAAPKDRVESWSQDLDALVQRFLHYDRSFSSGERARFIEDIDALRGELPKLDDAQVMMRMASAVALARNAHTRLYLLRNRTELRRLPIRLWWFRDGLYIVRTTPAYKQLLGCRVDAFNGTIARQARDVVSAGFAGNPSWKDYRSVYSLTSPETLHGFGITPDVEHVDIDVSQCAVTRARIEPLPLLKKSKATEAWWDLSPVHKDADHEWVHVLKDAPLYLRDPNHNYWYAYLPESGIFYLQYNRASVDEPEKAFAERALAEFDAHEVKGLVVDLRFNTGGDNSVLADFMRQLQEKSAKVPRWVITGRATFSAGIAHLAAWKIPNVTFVGEPAGDGTAFWSEGGNIILPNSHLYAHFANGEQRYDVPTIAPDIPVAQTSEEYVKGKDAAMEAILRPHS